MFQSLLGFLMRCDLNDARSSCIGPSFQSLLGFLMRCDYRLLFLRRIAAKVSIPAGFSDALRPDGTRNETRILVSIPAGFSDALRRGEDVDG